jgi:hypothetical protein
MISQMSQREKTLALLVGGAIAILLNVFLFQFFLGKYNQSRTDKLAAEKKLQMFRLLESEREKWSKRDAWLTSRLVPMGDQDVANKHQREALQEIAKKHQVLIESIAPGVPNRLPAYTSLGIRLECKGSWKQMPLFLDELQSPENFTAIEALELKVDPTDKFVLRASMTVAKLFSPKG